MQKGLNRHDPIYQFCGWLYGEAIPNDALRGDVEVSARVRDFLEFIALLNIGKVG